MYINVHISQYTLVNPSLNQVNSTFLKKNRIYPSIQGDLRWITVSVIHYSIREKYRQNSHYHLEICWGLFKIIKYLLVFKTLKISIFSELNNSDLKESSEKIKLKKEIFVISIEVINTLSPLLCLWTASMILLVHPLCR